MTGFNQDPLQFINLIADNLRDRYDRNSVLKELIQNADDAGAHRLDFGLSAGVANAEHPLLLGPGLFFINDGILREEDARGIRSFGLNSKAAEKSSIGKFGLGMKSVFHFCEAFFFLGGDRGKPYQNILNPWSGGPDYKSIHADWDRFIGADAERLREHLKGVIQTQGYASLEYHPFILWLPLRQQRHLELPDGEKAGAIVPEFPGDEDRLDFLYDSELPSKLAQLLPLLRHLSHLSFREINNTNSPVPPRFSIDMRDAGSRLSLSEREPEMSPDEEPAVNDLVGHIDVQTGSDTIPLAYSGVRAIA